MAKIKDIYSGELMQVWEDDDFVFVNFFPNGCTLTFMPEDWETIKREFQTLSTGSLVTPKENLNEA